MSGSGSQQAMAERRTAAPSPISHDRPPHLPLDDEDTRARCRASSPTQARRAASVAATDAASVEPIRRAEFARYRAPGVAGVQTSLDTRQTLRAESSRVLALDDDAQA